MKNLKPVPADKKKSLGKLPTDVRNKMGYAKRGSMMKARYGTMAKGDVKEGLKKSSEFKRKLEDFRYNAIKRIRGAKAGPAEEAKLNEMMPSVKDSPSIRESKMKAVKMKLSKLKTGGEMASNRRKRLKDVQNPKSEYDKKGKLKYTAAKEGKMMKKPMKAVLGAAVAAGLGAGLLKKTMKKKASASPGMNLLSKESGMKLPMKDLYQKATEQQMAKKSMGGEMKQGYGAARTSGMGLQDEDLIPGKSMDYYKDLM